MEALYTWLGYLTMTRDDENDEKIAELKRLLVERIRQEGKKRKERRQYAEELFKLIRQNVPEPLQTKMLFNVIVMAELSTEDVEELLGHFPSAINLPEYPRTDNQGRIVEILQRIDSLLTTLKIASENLTEVSKDLKSKFSTSVEKIDKEHMFLKIMQWLYTSQISGLTELAIASKDLKAIRLAELKKWEELRDYLYEKKYSKLLLLFREVETLELINKTVDKGIEAYLNDALILHKCPNCGKEYRLPPWKKDRRSFKCPICFEYEYINRLVAEGWGLEINAQDMEDDYLRMMDEERIEREEEEFEELDEESVIKREEER